MKKLHSSVLLVACAGLALFVACAGGMGSGGGSSPEDVVRASALLQSLKADHESGNLDAAAATAREIISRYPDFASLDEVYYHAGAIAAERSAYVDAARNFDKVVAGPASSPFMGLSLLGAAESYIHLEKHVTAAERLLQLLDGPTDRETREQASGLLQELVRMHLGPADLAALARRFPASDLNEEIALQLARKEYARADYDECYRLLAQYLYQFPEGEGAVEARRLLKLASERREAPAQIPATIVNPDRIGVILPITGEYSLFGRYFDQGVDVAVEEYNRTAKRAVSVSKADTRGAPITTVKAVRKLISEDGCVALLGGVLTMPSVTAAVEANAWRVPLLSPVAASLEISEIGPWVYQTKIPQTIEVSTMARLAVTRLRLGRYAVLAPGTGERRALGEYFSEEVERLGGEVVALEYYEEGASDYRQQLDIVREAAPEAIFIPGSVEELLLLLPQIKFYDMQVQLLGLSNWNSERLIRISRDELEGALFPLEAYRGRDEDAYERFKIAMEEKGVTELSPVSVAGYFGMRLLLGAIAEGASDREGVRDYLEREISLGAADRSEESASLKVLTVKSGRVREFRAPARSDR